MKPVPVHLADVLRMTQALPRADWAAAASAMGYALKPEAPPPLREAEQRQPEPPPSNAAAPAAPAGPEPAPDLQPWFWRLWSDLSDPAASDMPAWLSDVLREPPPPGCFVSATGNQVPPGRPLVAWARLAGFVHRQLARPRPTLQLDLRWCVARVARGEAVTRARRLHRRRWPVAITVVLQRHADLRPLDADLSALQRQLARWWGGRAVQLTTAESPLHLSDAEGRAARVRADGQPVLVLGDAGVYTGDPAQPLAWRRWARALEQSGARPLLLAPLPRRLLPAAVAGAFDTALLDDGPRLRLLVPPRREREALSRGAPPSGDALDALSGLLAGLAAVPPALVRHVRRALARERIPGADLAAEALWRQRPDVASGRVFARVWPAHEAQALQRLRQVLPPAALARLVPLVHALSAGLSPLLRAERTETWSRHADDLLALLGDERDRARQHAQQLWQWLAAALHRAPQDDTLSLAAYMGAVGRHHPALVGQGPPALQLAWALAHPHALRAGDPELLPPGLALDQLAWLTPPDGERTLRFQAVMGAGRQVRLTLAAPGPGVAGAGLCDGLPGVSLLGLRPVDDLDGEPAGPQHLVPATAGLGVAAGQRWCLQAGSRRLLLDAVQKPDWASDIWRDGTQLRATLPGGRVLLWVPQQRLYLDGAAGGLPSFVLPHGAWWDEAEFQAFVAGGRPMACPAWALAGHGVDAHGYWAATLLRGVQQLFRFVPPGPFTMGSPATEEGRYDDEQLHEVILTRGFWLADTVCTQALWSAVTGRNPARFADDPERPVEQVSWDDVQLFIADAERLQPGLGLRLPTEAEWEYAARNAGHATGARHWGEGIDRTKARYDSSNGTVPVKAMAASALGLHQMLGNVWEWVMDGYSLGSTEAVAVDPGREAKDQASGPRVIRGGCWWFEARSCRSAVRNHVGPGMRGDDLGFRLARGLLSGPGPAEPAGLVRGEPEARRSGSGAPEPAAHQRGRRR